MTEDRLCITDVHELPWFNEVLAKSQKELAETPERFWPSWYREYRENQE